MNNWIDDKNEKNDENLIPFTNERADERLALHNADREELCPATAALLIENGRGFDLLLADLRRECAPQNTTEDLVVQTMARHAWSALRRTRMETGLVEVQVDNSNHNFHIKNFAAAN